jgi:hypothetical protein
MVAIRAAEEFLCFAESKGKQSGANTRNEIRTAGATERWSSRADSRHAGSTEGRELRCFL